MPATYCHECQTTYGDAKPCKCGKILSSAESNCSTVSLDDFNQAVDGRNAVIVDILKIVEAVRREVNIKQMQSIVERDFAQIGACEILSRVITDMYNKMSQRIQVFADQ